jgi:hypothetical protein
VALKIFLPSSVSSCSPCLFQLAITFLMNRLLVAFQHVQWCHVACGRMELLSRDLSSLCPAIHIVDDLITGVVGDPASTQGSQLAFSSCTCFCSSTTCAA